MARNRQRAKDRKQKLHRDNVPGSLDHASAEVDEVEARIVAGAEGVPLDEPVGDRDADSDTRSELEAAPDIDESLDREQLGRGTTPPATRSPSGSRLANFIRACWAELQRVDWPDRRQVGQATTVVLGFVVIAGAFLGLADVVAQKIVDLII